MVTPRSPSNIDDVLQERRYQLQGQGQLPHDREPAAGAAAATAARNTNAQQADEIRPLEELPAQADWTPPLQLHGGREAPTQMPEAHSSSQRTNAQTVAAEQSAAEGQLEEQQQPLFQFQEDGGTGSCLPQPQGLRRDTSSGRSSASNSSTSRNQCGTTSSEIDAVVGSTEHVLAKLKGDEPGLSPPTVRCHPALDTEAYLSCSSSSSSSSSSSNAFSWNSLAWRSPVVTPRTPAAESPVAESPVSNRPAAREQLAQTTQQQQQQEQQEMPLTPSAVPPAPLIAEQRQREELQALPLQLLEQQQDHHQQLQQLRREQRLRQPRGLHIDRHMVLRRLQEHVQQHEAVIPTLRNYYEALFTAIHSLHMIERANLPPWEPLGGPPWPRHQAHMEGPPQGRGPPQADPWGPRGRRPRAMVEFEVDLVQADRSDMIQTAGQKLGDLEVLVATGVRLVRRGIETLEQHEQQKRERQQHQQQEGLVDVRVQLQRQTEEEQRQRKELIYYHEVRQTLVGQTELWVNLRDIAKKLDKAAPLVGGWPIKLTRVTIPLPGAEPIYRGHREAYAVPSLLPVPEADVAAEAAEAAVAAAEAAEPSGPSRPRPTAAAPAAAAQAAATPVSAAASATAAAAAPAPVETAQIAAAESSTTAAQDGTATGAATAPGTAGRVGTSRAARSRTRNARSRRAAQVAQAAAAVEAAAAAQPVIPAADMEEFGIRQFPGPIVVRNPRTHPLPCRRLRQGPLGPDGRPRWGAIGRPGHTAIPLPLWMQRQPREAFPESVYTLPLPRLPGQVREADEMSLDELQEMGFPLDMLVRWDPGQELREFHAQMELQNAEGYAGPRWELPGGPGAARRPLPAMHNRARVLPAGGDGNPLSAESSTANPSPTQSANASSPPTSAKTDSPPMGSPEASLGDIEGTAEARESVSGEPPNPDTESRPSSSASKPLEPHRGDNRENLEAVQAPKSAAAAPGTPTAPGQMPPGEKREDN